MNLRTGLALFLTVFGSVSASETKQNSHRAQFKVVSDNCVFPLAHLGAEPTRDQLDSFARTRLEAYSAVELRFPSWQTAEKRKLSKVVAGQPWLFPFIPVLANIHDWVAVRDISTQEIGYMGHYQSTLYGRGQILIPPAADKNGIVISFKTEGRESQLTEPELLALVERKATYGFKGIERTQENAIYTVSHILPGDFSRGELEGPGAKLLKILVNGDPK